MSVLEYLETIAEKCIVDDADKEKIDVSIQTLQSRLNSFFPSGIQEQFRFGSSTRKTMLPKEIDEDADIDYMVVFEDLQCQPQTYLNHLKNFVESSYSASEIHQSHPTIVLKLNHIKFELVPAITSMCSLNYKIPGKNEDYEFWKDTNPLRFNKELDTTDIRNRGKVRKLIRILKYWNVCNSKVFESYKLEEDIVNKYNQFYGISTYDNIKDALYYYVENLTIDADLSQEKKGKIKSLKSHISTMKLYDGVDGLSDWAKNIAESLFPKI